MKFTKYNKLSEFSCVYEYCLNKKMQPCGRPAIGHTGTNSYLCKEHFDYLRVMNRVHEKEVEKKEIKGAREIKIE